MSTKADYKREMKERENKSRFVNAIKDDLEHQVKHSKVSIEKLAGSFSITNKNLVKELTELAIVKIAREIAHCDKCPETGQIHTVRQKYDKIVDLYNHQVNLSMRTSESMLLQQYSTPAPIAYLAGEYVLQGLPEKYIVLEPSAGNGLLTIAFAPSRVVVNEMDDIRLENLKTQRFALVKSEDASKDLRLELHGAEFDGIITNPPFGTLEYTLTVGKEGDQFKITTLDHLMAIRVLDVMKDTGRAAIIIGGHTKWDEMGRVQAGKNRMFLNYLYRYYYVDDVINIDGHKLYSRQGTSFDVRLILIHGRKQKPEGAAPLNNPQNSPVVDDFDSLYYRVLVNPRERTRQDEEIKNAFSPEKNPVKSPVKSPVKNPDNDVIQLARVRAKALSLKLKLMRL